MHGNNIKSRGAPADIIEQRGVETCWRSGTIKKAGKPWYWTVWGLLQIAITDCHCTLLRETRKRKNFPEDIE